MCSRPRDGSLFVFRGEIAVIVVMEPGATQAQLEAVVQKIRDAGLNTHLSVGTERTLIGVVGDSHTKELLRDTLEASPGVEKVVRILQPFKLVSREFRPSGTVVRVGGAAFGDTAVAVAAGPCSVESREQILQTAEAVKAAGATLLRGGAFKPRTSPYSFQGLEEEGLKLLVEARQRTGLPVVTEAMDAHQLLLAAEYVMNEGNYEVVLCERGIRGFGNYTRYTLDLSAVPVLKHLTHLPVIVDPSHATGKWRYVEALALAAVAGGADGLLVEVHPDPERALSDGPQSLNLENFNRMMARLRAAAQAGGRGGGGAPPTRRTWNWSAFGTPM